VLVSYIEQMRAGGGKELGFRPLSELTLVWRKRLSENGVERKNQKGKTPGEGRNPKICEAGIGSPAAWNVNQTPDQGPKEENRRTKKLVDKEDKVVGIVGESEKTNGGGGEER